MQNKLKFNVILLSVIVLLLIGLGYFFFNKSKLKNKEVINNIENNLPNEGNSIMNLEKISSNEGKTILQNETAVALIKEIYQKDEKFYVVLDYVTTNQDKIMGNLNITNLNKKLRTFELDLNTMIQLIRYKEDISERPIVTPTELFRILKNNGEDYYSLSFYQDKDAIDSPYYQAYGSLFSVNIKQGKLVELKQIYQE